MAMLTPSSLRCRVRHCSVLLVILMWLGACSGERASAFGQPDAAVDGGTEDDEDMVPDEAPSGDASLDAEVADPGRDASGPLATLDAGEPEAGQALRVEVRLEGDGRGSVQDSTGMIACGGDEGTCSSTLDDAR